MFIFFFPLLMQVYATTVKLLQDQELGELGLCMGDRATLREVCTEASRSKLTLFAS